MDQYDTAALMKALMGQPTGDMKTQAKNMALMNAGFAMLNTPGRFSQALGQGGMAGVGAYQGSLEQQRQEAMQRMGLGMQLEDYERKKQVRDLAPKFYRDPAQTALAEGGGPTMENAKRMESAGPSFDFAGYSQALAQYDPQGAAALQASMAKDTPFAKIDPKDYTTDSLSKFLQSRNYADLSPVRKKDVVNGQAVDLYQAQSGQVFDDVDPNKPFNIKGGEVVPNDPFQRYSLEKASRSAARNTISVNTGQKGFENESKLRNDFKQEPIYKDYSDMKSAYAQIKTSINQETPVGDMAAATKIMKLLDPGSVVRESELGMAMAATGKMDRLQNFVQMQISGEKLTPKQRQEFSVLADELMAATTQAYNTKRGEYAEFGASYGLNPDKSLGAPASAPKQVKRTGKYQGRTVVEYADGTVEYKD